MTLATHVRTHLGPLFRPMLDYALPPRCPACGVIVATPNTLCAPCWGTIDFLTEPLCASCGADMPDHVPGESVRCGACLAEPPAYDRARAVMRYGEVGRTLAHRLKYSRRISLARMMATQMARLLPLDRDDGAIMLPVPLHRWRIWARGFNQAALIGQELARQTGLEFEPALLRRTVNTPPLHSLGPRARRSALKGAFALTADASTRIAGRTVILIDDIWTTGATTSACARVLRAGGAGRVEILCWTRAGSASD